MEQPGWYYGPLRTTKLDEQLAYAVDQQSDQATKSGRRRPPVEFPFTMALAALALPLLWTPRGALITRALPRSLRTATRARHLLASEGVRPALSLWRT